MDSETRQFTPRFEGKTVGDRKNNRSKRPRNRHNFDDKGKRLRNVTRSIDYNHGHGPRPLFPFNPPMHDMPPIPPDQNYYGAGGFNDFRRQPDPDAFHRPPHDDVFSDHHGPPMHDMNNRPSMHNMHNSPPIHNMHNGPPMHDVCNGPPVNNMLNAPPINNLRGGPPIHDIHNGPPVRISGPPPMHDILNGPLMHDRPNGPLMHDRPNGPLMHDRPNGPLMHDRPNGPLMHDRPNGPLMHDRPNGPPLHNMSNHDMHCRSHGPSPPEVYDGRHTSDGFPVPPGSEFHGGQHDPGPNSHYGANHPNHCYPGPEKERFGIHSLADGHLAPHKLPRPDLYCRPADPDGQNALRGINMQPNTHSHNFDVPPDHVANSAKSRGSASYPSNCNSKVPDASTKSLPPPINHPHHSPIYPIMPIGAGPLPYIHSPQVPPPNIPTSYPSIDPSNPPLPQTPPPNHQPPLPPSPPSPSPRPPSPTSPPPESHEIKTCDVVEGFTSGSSSESPDISEKQKESIITKYVKRAQKLKTTSNFVQPVEKFVNNKKQTNNIKPKEKVKSPNKAEESPARPSLDARLKLMFGAPPEKESPKKDKKRSPKPPAQEVNKDSQEFSRPLSPPPSPFRSRQMYHYWHKVTLRMRKASKISSVDFVNANVRSGHQKKLNRLGQLQKFVGPVKPPPKPSNPLPKKLPSSTVDMKSDDNKILANLSNSLTNSALRICDQTHSPKSESLRESVIQGSLDAEIELTCEGSLEMNEKASQLEVSMCAIGNASVNSEDGNMDRGKCKSLINVEMMETESCVESKTVNFVLSKILEELRCVIKKELAGDILDKEIGRFIDTKKS